jgi:quinoprotein dehydrogenase-associated probable ABC transporter substrate-binding protein
MYRNTRIALFVAIAASGLTTIHSAAAADGVEIRALRVCADPGNMPLSNEKGDGYQNKIAQVLGEALGTGVQYDFRPSTERGLLRGTLDANTCDVMFDVPADMERVLTTTPLYRSTFVFAYRNDRNYAFKSLDDPLLKKLKIGVYQMSSIRESLGKHDIKENTVTHFISYDGAKVPENQPSYQVQRMINGELDIVAIWGSFAGYYKTMKQAPITLQPVNLMDDNEPLEFEMALAVRRGDRGLKEKLDEVMRTEKDKIRKILDDYGVPLVQCDTCIISGELLAHGPYKGDAERQLAATQAAAKQQPDVTIDQLKQWLKDGANVNDELSNAATAGDLGRVRYLVENGGDVNTRDAEGYTPLLTAVRTRYHDIAAYLVEHGADVNLVDNDGWTPLMFAAWRDSPDIIQILIAKGATIETANPKGLTALCIAAQHGKTDAATALIGAGANIEKVVGAGAYTPLMLALVGGWEEAAARLVAKGANVNAHNAAGITPLMIAAAGNRVDSAKLLIAKGANVNAKGEDGITALGIASERENKAVIEVLQQAASNRHGSASGKPAKNG